MAGENYDRIFQGLREDRGVDTHNYSCDCASCKSVRGLTEVALVTQGNYKPTEAMRDSYGTFNPEDY